MHIRGYYAYAVEYFSFWVFKIIRFLNVFAGDARKYAAEVYADNVYAFMWVIYSIWRFGQISLAGIQGVSGQQTDLPS